MIKLIKRHFLKRKMQRCFQQFVEGKVEQGFDVETAVLILVSYLNGIDAGVEWEIVSITKEQYEKDNNIRQNNHR